jgi:hypothetical protein
MSLNRNVRAVYRIAGRILGGDFEHHFGNNGWAEFQEAITIRHRVTHPKSVEDCRVLSEQVELLVRSELWFRELHNDFICVASDHKRREGW